MTDPSMLLLARAGDPAVQTLRHLLRRRLRHADVTDLSRAGWRYVVGRPDLASACVGGQVLPAEQITAVLCRVAAVVPQDLVHLHVEDRAFAAGEMNAFLRAWLTQFSGVCCNESDATSLAGPAWHPMRWRWLAAQAGVAAVRESQVTTDSAPSTRQTATVVVVGDKVIGTGDAMLVRDSLRIAHAARCGLLALRFEKDRDWRFESADPSPPLNLQCAEELIAWAFSARPDTAINAGSVARECAR